MEQAGQVRVAGPSRVVLALATGALVLLTSGATAFVVLTGTGGVAGPQQPFEPLPSPVPRASERPVVVVQPEALATLAPAAPSRAPRRTAPLVLAGPRTQPAPLLPPVVPEVLPFVPPVVEPVVGPGRPGPVGPEPVVEVPEPVEPPVFGPRLPPMGPAIPYDDQTPRRPVTPAVPAVPAVPASPTGDRAIPAVPASPSRAHADKPAKAKGSKPAKGKKEAKPGRATGKATSAGKSNAKKAGKKAANKAKAVRGTPARGNSSKARGRSAR